MHETLSKLTKGREDFGMSLSSKITTYNRVDLDYESKINANNFNNICNVNTSSKCNGLTFSYCNKNGHVALFCLVRKIHENNNDYSS